MDEDNYREIYRRINGAPCVFEKGILSSKCQCHFQHTFCLADRHGVACTDTVMQINCKAFLDHLRQQTRFVFKINIDGPLPHNKEIKVQNGGMLGVQKLLSDGVSETVEDIAGSMLQAIEKFGSVEALPYDQIMQSVTSYKTRAKRQSRKNKR